MLVKEFNKDTKTFFAIECQKRLYKKISKYQKIEIYSSIYYGNILLLQDCFMLTEKNSNQYKETCISVIRKKKLDNVLIIGGGDFEIAHHLFENKIIKKLSIVEIDYDVVKSCKKYFPLNHNLKKNEKNKINLVIDDGYKWLKEYKGDLFDLVIIDCTDPNTSADVLYSSKFYNIVNERLRKKGVFIQQSGSPLLHEKSLIKPMRKKLERYSFSNIKTVEFPMPIYPSGSWSFTVCKKV
tara:strand:- start:1225 stop:1941 length:717 start_codon:yes stop_codon:yes gene_type:complete